MNDKSRDNRFVVNRQDGVSGNTKLIIFTNMSNLIYTCIDNTYIYIYKIENINPLLGFKVDTKSQTIMQ